MRLTPITWLLANAGKFLLVAGLAIPAVVAYKEPATPDGENRNLAALPARPTSWKALLEMPPKVNNWVNDHFGFRDLLVQMNSQLRFTLFDEFPTIQMAAGQHGRYFLAAHSINSPPYQAITKVCGRMSSPNPEIPAYLSHMFADFHRMGLQPKLLLVPSALVVYPEDAPAWLVPSCAETATPVTAVLNSPQLSAEARAQILFPLPEMREIKKTASLYPLTWFHWAGPGLDQVARLSLTRLFGKSLADAGPPLVTRGEARKSDVSYLFGGIDLPGVVVTGPDLAASGIKSCYGPDCYPEMGDVGRAVNDTSRFDNPQAAPRRLVIVSDSFGSKVSAWYARYYQTTEQFATNNMTQLTPQQMQTLKQYVLRDPAHTDILFIYHDGGGVYETLQMGLHRFHQ